MNNKWIIYYHMTLEHASTKAQSPPTTTFSRSNTMSRVSAQQQLTYTHNIQLKRSLTGFTRSVSALQHFKQQCKNSVNITSHHNKGCNQYFWSMVPNSWAFGDGGFFNMTNARNHSNWERGRAHQLSHNFLYLAGHSGRGWDGDPEPRSPLDS